MPIQGSRNSHRGNSSAAAERASVRLFVLRLWIVYVFRTFAARSVFRTWGPWKMASTNNAGRVNFVWIQLPSFDKLFDFTIT